MSDTGRKDHTSRIRVAQEGEWYAHRMLWFRVVGPLRRLFQQDREALEVGVAILVITHACFEAHLNYLGESLYARLWPELERQRLPKKFNLLADELGVEFDRSRRPYSTLANLIKWRNRTVHAGIVRRSEEFTLDSDRLPVLESGFLRDATPTFVERAIEDIEGICDTLQAAAHRQYPKKYLGDGAFSPFMGKTAATDFRAAD